MALREVLAQFSVAVDGLGQIEKAEKSVNKFAGRLAGLNNLGAGVGLTLAAGAAFSFVDGLIKTGAEINTFSQRLGVSSDELQQWRYMAEHTGAKANDLTLAMKMLEQHLSDSGNGFKNKGFDHLGIQLKDAEGKARPVTDVLGDLAEKVSKMDSEADKTALALHTMGKGGIAILPLLKQGREGVERLTKRFQELGGGLSKEFVEDATKAKQAQVDLSYSTLGLKDHIGRQLIPIVTAVTHKLATFMGGVGKLVKGTQSARTVMLALGAASVVTGGRLALGAASKLGLIAKVADGASRGVLGTAKAFAQLGWQALKFAIPLALAFLILEDIMTFLNGGRSVTGTLIDAIFGEGTADKVREDLKGIKEDLIKVFDDSKPYLKEFAKATAEFLRDMFQGFKGYGQMFHEFFEFLGKDIDNWWKQLETDHPVLAKLLTIGKKLNPIYQIAHANDSGQSHNIFSATYDAVTSGGSSGGGGPIVQNNDTTINVTAPSAAEAAKGVFSGIKEVNRDNAATFNAVVR